ncbi:hypothetical protein JET14_13395 [Martelella lutilitoris]|uniref:Uncharacterized protein n=1 Tax=Martelella lutilitoris TaxID=2583532 RepID=A0A7T7HHK2_9HYPH|nr:hypothetical protein [Martelella lutilitoris]QQM29319.1 hypothetical protein JET14_13395 [Martelella lutilitoris]
MNFSFNMTVAKELGWSSGDKIEVLIGDGEHHGIIRMRKNNSVGDAEFVRRDAAKGAYFKIALGPQSAFVDRSETARWCAFEILDGDDAGWLEIILPRWADETGPKMRDKTSAPAMPARPVAQTPARNVTAAVMGDPPPGRRQMLDKLSDIKG